MPKILQNSTFVPDWQNLFEHLQCPLRLSLDNQIKTDFLIKMLNQKSDYIIKSPSELLESDCIVVMKAIKWTHVKIY